MIETTAQPLARVVTDLSVRGDSPGSYTPGDTNAGIVFSINTYKMRAHMSATQALVGTGEPATTCKVDTIDYDNTGNFNTSTYQFTIPISGYWFIAGKVNINVGAVAWTSLSWVARVYRNGNRLSEGVTVSVVGNPIYNGGYDAMVTDCVYLDSGDLIDLRAAMVNSASANATIENNLFTYLTLHLISR